MNPLARNSRRPDPIGLVFENFDVTGAWRARDEGNPIDTSSELYDGSPITGVEDIRNAILSRPEVFYRIFTENMMAYALGRRVEYYDMPSVRQITEDAEEEDYRLSAFVAGVVNSPALRTTRAAQPVVAEQQPVTESGTN